MAGRSDNWLYEKNRNNSARYILGENGKKPLVCIGINPSTAKPNNLDRTLATVKRISELNGYEGWLMLNVYPQRSTDPDRLHDVLDKRLHSYNLNHISEYLSQHHSGDVWAAWGTLITKRPYLISALRDIVERLDESHVRWVKIGKLSKAGHPHHPLYLSHQSKIEPFDIKGYLRRD